MMWLLVGAFVFFASIALMLAFFVMWMRKKSLSARAIIVHDDGATKTMNFQRAPKSFVVDKKRYIYDERATIRLNGLKHLIYRYDVAEPISIFSAKNPRPLSSTEYEGLMKSQVHLELFGSSEIASIKIFVMLTLAAASAAAIIALLILFTQGPPEAVTLASDPATREVIASAVREAIGR